MKSSRPRAGIVMDAALLFARAAFAADFSASPASGVAPSAVSLSHPHESGKNVGRKPVARVPLPRADFAVECDNSATIATGDSCTILGCGGPVYLDTNRRRLCFLPGGSSHWWPNTPGGEATMPILLWYLPYTMFSGACDLVLSEFETQVTGERRIEFGEPLLEADEPVGATGFN